MASVQHRLLSVLASGREADGNRLGTFALRLRFDKARKAAGVSFQFRDLRAKAATDTGDLAHTQKLLGHRNCEMTEHSCALESASACSR